MVERSNKTQAGRNEENVAGTSNASAENFVSEPTALTSQEDMPLELLKYWFGRHNLFSEFDTPPGIQLDAQSWYSVTPEAIAVRCAHRCASLSQARIVLDAFCGAGGNAIAFARAGLQVVALDIDPVKLRMCMHNAVIYGVSDLITPICGDFFEFAQGLDHGKVTGKWNGADKSPPWGGVNYLAPATPGHGESYDYYAMSSLCAPHGGRALMNAARSLSQNLALFLPRSVALEDVRALAFAQGKEPEQLDEVVVDVEEQWVGHRLSGIMAYYGKLAVYVEAEDAAWGWGTRTQTQPTNKAKNGKKTKKKQKHTSQK